MCIFTFLGKNVANHRDLWYNWTMIQLCEADTINSYFNKFALAYPNSGDFL